MKITASQFAKFKDAFLFWQKEFGCMDYRIEFELCKLEHLANIQINQKGRIAIVRVADDVSDKLDIESYNPADLGKHEAIHLLLSRLSNLPFVMGVTQREIEDLDESCVRVLEKLL